MLSMTRQPHLQQPWRLHKCTPFIGLLRARGTGGAHVVELDWHAAPPGALRALGAPPPDYVIAADCLYVDPGGATPDAAAFVRACAALSGPGTRCLVALEERSADVMLAFYSCAEAAGFNLVRAPHA